MRAFDRFTFFKELNLENLGDIQKEKIWRKFIELVSLEVLDKVLDELSQKEAEELFLNLSNNPGKVEKFLAKNPKFTQITQNSIIKIKKEIRKFGEKL